MYKKYTNLLNNTITLPSGQVKHKKVSYGSVDFRYSPPTPPKQIHLLYSYIKLFERGIYSLKRGFTPLKHPFFR